MVATVAAIQDRLVAGNGLLYRYLPAESTDAPPPTDAGTCPPASASGTAHIDSG